MEEIPEALENMMDLDMDNNQRLGDAVLDEEDYNEYSAFGHERCGICMDVVIDRGILDCCNDWFCFACIDSWASITNLCPFCKNEFQLITCLPVYDTLGNFMVDDHPLERDDDWCIQEKNNTLSFPSYYINEDAVRCLDADGCKVRNGLSTLEENLILDTSIACDSCDMWYHAFCVGFDPETTSGTSWLCPRCITGKVPYHYNQKSANCGHLIESPFTGRVSISVADAGETAVVVSMVDGKQPIIATVESQPDTVPKDGWKKRSLTEFSYSTISSPQNESCSGVLIPTAESISNDKSTGVQRSKPSYDLSPGMDLAVPDVILGDPFASPSPSPKALLPIYSSTQPSSGIGKALLSPSGLQDLSSCISDGRKMLNQFLNNSSTESVSSGNKDVNIACEAAEEESVGVKKEPADGSVEGEKMATADGNHIPRVINQNTINAFNKNGTQISRDDVHITNQTMKRERDSQCEMEITIPTKKARSCENSHMIPLRCQVSTSTSSQRKLMSETTSKDDELIDTIGQETGNLDIMSIVQGVKCGSSNRLRTTSSGERTNNTNGFRVKKIMRISESKESSNIVKKLREEIREVVHNNPSKDFGKYGSFDGKLLSAFRAVIAGTRNDLPNKVDPSIYRMKKSLLQTGKARENLTKKIYGTASGRRRRAWDRDWEIEFWKHRCLRGKGEKVETLQSVLDLLKKVSCSENLDMKDSPEDTSKDSILSRVYVADTSVFPRNEDIRPLSALAGSSMISKPNNYMEKGSQLISVNHNSEKTTVPSSIHMNKGSNSRVSTIDLKTEDQTYISASSKTKNNAKNWKELHHQPIKDKADKKKWALEVLARKNTSTDRGPCQGKQEDNTMLKGSYPLLAQLPADMRPAVAPSSHSKIPLSVRQTQLCRLLEFYLRGANLPVICRTAATELAVADAVNVEKEICERSISKLVYINLCSQHTINCKLHTAEKITSDGSPVSDEKIELAGKEGGSIAEEECDSIEETLRMTGLFSNSPPNTPEQPTRGPSDEDTSLMNLEDNNLHDVLDLDSNVEETLRMTGLFSDSPPNTLEQPTRGPSDEDTSLMNLEDDNLHDVLNLDSYVDLDAYGDSVYNMEDKRYTASSGICRALNSNLQDTNLKTSMVLATPNNEKLGINHEFQDALSRVTIEHVKTENIFDELVVAEVPSDSPTMPICQKERVMGDLQNIFTNNQGSVIETSDKEHYEQPSCPEFEEFYGLTEEPLIEKIPKEKGGATVETAIPCENEKDQSGNHASDLGFQGESYAENNIVGGTLSLEHENFEGEKSPNHSVLSGNVRQKVTAEPATPGENEKDQSRNDASDIAGGRLSLKHENFGENLPNHSVMSGNNLQKERRASPNSNRLHDSRNSVSPKVEAYIKEHIRPLYKSGVITAEQYRWAVGKTTDKVMRYHSKAKNANFLIKEGEKVKKLAEQYVEASQQKDWKQRDGNKGNAILLQNG